MPEGEIKVRRGWVWEGVSPSHTLGEKNQNMNEMVASPTFSEPKHRLNGFQNKSEKQSKSFCFGSGLLQNRYICNVNMVKT